MQEVHVPSFSETSQTNVNRYYYSIVLVALPIIQDTFLLDAHLGVGEDAESSGSAAAGLCDVNKYDDGAAGDP